MFFQKIHKGKKKQKYTRKKAKRQIKNFLAVQQMRNEKMGCGTDPFGFCENAKKYAYALKDLDSGLYGNVKKLLHAEIKDLKRAVRIAGKHSPEKKKLEKITLAIKKFFTVCNQIRTQA